MEGLIAGDFHGDDTAKYVLLFGTTVSSIIYLFYVVKYHDAMIERLLMNGFGQMSY